ncbi:MAG: valine--tRNA ligase, partial [Candidatus Omnitrophica bacterium]|nr:valine--tRNA ligase [Candidatus Omnitrophota bacterium]
DPKLIEAEILSSWLSNNHFQAKADLNKDPYTIVIPPPNITGILHMGHALNNTIQDVLIRFNRMKGKSALWMPGTDHAGIATQNVVEKQLAKKGMKKEDLGREEFEKKLWQWKEDYGSTIINQLKSLGSSCDWNRLRFTMDEGYSLAVKEVFIRLFDKGLIYRGNYIINWCPRCHTALSDEESAHKEIDGWLYYIKYPVSSSAGSPDHIVVATTRPETMLGDTAIAINPDDARYKWLINSDITLPLVGRKLRLIQDKAIDPQFGTGVVKVTPAHDPLDFSLGKTYNLEFINIMNGDGTLNENVPDDFIGMDRFEAREAILTILKDKGLILKKEPHGISAGHCYRCNTVIEPRVSLQWFVKMKPLAKEAIRVVEEGKVTFFPERWKKVYLNWMNNIQDWCISRQIWWGHRIPVYYCENCIKTRIENKESEEFLNRGLIVARNKPSNCPECGSSEITQDPDVLDTWFSSWLWPFATFNWPDRSIDPSKEIDPDLEYFFPTDCLVTASEILFFWVARMIMASLEFKSDIPFKHVLIHGTVRDEKGIKMSKSLGNTIDPLDIIEKFGADALRFSLMLSAASGSDVYLTEERFLVGRNFCNKIWNASRFIFLKIKENRLDFSDFEIEELKSVDAWILKELALAIDSFCGHIADYSINEATKKIYDFFWHYFCDWYIEIIKDNVDSRRAKILLKVLVDSLKLLHPIMPFISEKIYSLIKLQVKGLKEQFLISSSWPLKTDTSAFSRQILVTELLIDTVKSIRNIKIDLNLGQKKIDLQLLASDNDIAKAWQENFPWISRMAAIGKISPVKSLDQTLYKNDLWSINFLIGNSDMTAFIATLSKKIENITKALEKVNSRLNNNRFLESASTQVIENEKNKRSDMTGELKRLNSLKNAFI